ncbi:hypothetical protein LTR24_010282 [Lithohypha guttulata]|uniref:Uncharacterized protein n=1 Tax=Lithohypha guttulata TaxID=1690604 RepID=A0ABR0JUF8_9EURO|nr:hypothetical protein LTR24_010282 [Lithohypha guttulata]
MRTSLTTLKVSKDERTTYTTSGRAHTASIDCRLRDKVVTGPVLSENPRARSMGLQPPTNPWRKTLKTKLSSVFERRIINDDRSPTSEQQRGLDAYESHLREHPDNYIRSLLHFAVARSDDQLLEHALAHGLRQHGNVHYKGPVGRQPIDVALQKEHIRTIEKLIQHGAEADLTNFLKSLAQRNRASTLEGLL